MFGCQPPRHREPSLGDRVHHPEGGVLRRVRLTWAWSLCLATSWLGDSEQVMSLAGAFSSAHLSGPWEG